MNNINCNKTYLQIYSAIRTDLHKHAETIIFEIDHITSHFVIAVIQTVPITRDFEFKSRTGSYTGEIALDLTYVQNCLRYIHP